MKRAMLAMFVTFLPLAVAAQEPQTPATPSDKDTTVSSATAATVDAQAPAPRRSTKRRGSMVGYIEDPSVASGVRIRFDAGWDLDSPDRAEFFYAKCGCYRDLSGTALFDPEAPGPGPGVVTGMDYTQFNVLAEYAIKGRVSLFAELPFRSIKPTSFLTGTGSFDNQSGLGDITAGMKVSLFSDDASDVTLMVRGSMPSGDSLKGLGTDHGSVEPALLFRRDLGERAGIEGQFGYFRPLSSSQGPLATDGDFAGNVIYYGIGPSFDVVRTDRVAFSPVVELVAWHVIDGFQTSSLFTNGGDASGVNIANLKLGARTAWNNNSFYVGYGFAMTDDSWYGKILRFEYRARF